LPNDFLSKLRTAPNVHTFRDYILLPGRSDAEPNEVDLTTRVTKSIRISLPIVSSPMDSVTEWRMALAVARLGGVGVIHRNMSAQDEVEQVKRVKAAGGRFASTDSKGRPLVGAAVSPLDPDRCRALDGVADFLVADVAHFHNRKIMDATRKLLPGLSVDFVAGAVGTVAAAKEISEELPSVAGFRAGIGSGAVCTTSEVTRVGAPTLFAVAEVSTALAGKLDIPVIGDGGITGPGDAALALAAGASSVMLGMLLAGSDESPSRRVLVHGKKMKVHRGMASAAARKVRFALDRYSVPAKGLDEGVESYVPCTGPVDGTIKRMENGLRAAFGYAGATSIPSLWSVARFGLMSAVGSGELGAHSLKLKEAG
jgi:IMP dehydrogenase